MPAIHLDQLYHLPNTDWVPRLQIEFARLHDTAIDGESWVMEGNYSRLFQQRIARATGIVLLVDSRWLCLFRYIRRTLLERNRPGALAGGTDSLKWNMVRWILVTSPVNLRRYREELPTAGRPYLEVRGMKELRRLYETWRLI